MKTIYLITNGPPKPNTESICADTLEEARDYINSVKVSNNINNVSEKKYIYITKYIKIDNDYVVDSFIEKTWIK
jgi:hypothetical protein